MCNASLFMPMILNWLVLDGVLKLILVDITDQCQSPHVRIRTSVLDPRACLKEILIQV
jgi:hypothetical protein